MSKYTITEVFKHLPYLNMAKVAELSGINRSLLSQYAAGIKIPSDKQLKKVKQALREIGKELLSIDITN